MATEIKLPLPAEEVETVEVVAVKVKVGDVVAEGQALLEVEVEKSTVEVPAPVAGRVTELRVKKGDELHVGQTFCLIEAVEASQKEAAPPSKPEKPEPAKKAAEPSPRPPVNKDAAAQKPSEKKPAEKKPAEEKPAAAVSTEAAPEEKEDGELVLAGPATRQLARELGVALEQLAGSVQGRRITPEDVKTYVRRLASAQDGTSQTPAMADSDRLRAAARPELPDFSKWGPVERQPLDKVRRLTMQQMSLSWSLIPHVTQHDLADITELEAFRKQQDGRGPRLTVTAFALKAAALALAQFPQFNASLDAAAGEMVLKHYYHIGIAVDTERGLLVPVLQDVDKKSILDLAKELAEIAQQARDGKAPMRGGTFTISNLGGIGGTGFTPIINHPEVAILGMSRAQWQGVVQAGQIVPRLLLPLSLSYDHRVIDGAAAARFTRRIAELLSNPLDMLLLV